MDRFAMLLLTLGAVNWLAIGLFQLDLVAFVFGGQASLISRIVYAVIGLAGLWCAAAIFRQHLAARD